MFTQHDRWRAGLLFGLSLLALLSLARVAGKFVDPAFGSMDFHAYWYSGHALRQGHSPYRFALDHRKLDKPVSYLDLSGAPTVPVVRPNFPILATNTAPVFLPLAASAFVSWSNSRSLWLAMNIALLLVAPLLVIRLFPYGRSFTRFDYALIYLIFLALTSTRVALWIGQTTFLVFDLMLSSLLLRRTHRVWSGILLGLSLSKYSLSLGAALVLVWENRRANWLILGIAGLVQIGGLLLMSLFTADAPWTLLRDYVDVLRVFADSAHGYQLALLFPSGSALQVVAPLLLTISVFAFLIWQRVSRPWPPEVFGLARYEVFTILVLWTLLVAYHGIYDLAVAILVVPLGLLLCYQPDVWALSTRSRNWLRGLGLLALGLLMLPGTIVETVLPAELVAAWLLLFDRAIVLAILLLLLLLMWLLAQPHRAPQAMGQGSPELEVK